ATQSSILLDGGTLQVAGTAITALNRDIVLGGHGGTFDVAETGRTVTLQKVVTGDGGLTLAGEGRVISAVTNTYTGPTVITNTGGLQLGTGAALGRVQG